jgi:hypothetical protein
MVVAPAVFAAAATTQLLLLLLLLLLLRHGLVHMDLSPDNILMDREFVSQEEVS